MAPCFSFIAYSGTGKTTYLEKLIAELKARGKRVGVIKHDAHAFEIDREGKDSWRFARAGADAAAVADSTKWALVDYRPAPLEEILPHFRDVDLVLVEGWHAAARQAVALYRSGSGKGLRLPPEDCVAVVSDIPLETGNTPLFPLDDAAPMAEFLISML